jgi:hypothetical protein
VDVRVQGGHGEESVPPGPRSASGLVTNFPLGTAVEEARLAYGYGSAPFGAEAFKDNLVLDYAGLRATEMTPPQRERLLALVADYVNNQEEGHARVRIDEVRRHLDDTYFAWIGGTGPDSVFYYRVHSPVILVEFDHQSPANLRHLAADPRAPNRQHIHTLVRTPNGNDYGKDLLRQHYQRFKH